MNSTQIFVVVIFVVIIICVLSNQKESYYYTQAYYPYYYSSGYDDSYKELGYKGPGSYQYPGYSAEFAQQKETQCKLGCVQPMVYDQDTNNNEPNFGNCIQACKDANPYS